MSYLWAPLRPGIDSSAHPARRYTARSNVERLFEQCEVVYLPLKSQIVIGANSSESGRRAKKVTICARLLARAARR